VTQTGSYAPSRGFHRRGGGASLRIIVVDDDADTVQTLSAILEHEGHTVYGAHSGTEVLPMARFVRPDAILLDLSVPGSAVARSLR